MTTFSQQCVHKFVSGHTEGPPTHHVNTNKRQCLISIPFTVMQIVVALLSATPCLKGRLTCQLLAAV